MCVKCVVSLWAKGPLKLQHLSEREGMPSNTASRLLLKKETAGLQTSVMEWIDRSKEHAGGDR